MKIHIAKLYLSTLLVMSAASMYAMEKESFEAPYFQLNDNGKLIKLLVDVTSNTPKEFEIKQIWDRGGFMADQKDIIGIVTKDGLQILKEKLTLNELGGGKQGFTLEIDNDSNLNEELLLEGNYNPSTKNITATLSHKDKNTNIKKMLGNQFTFNVPSKNKKTAASINVNLKEDLKKSEINMSALPYTEAKEEITKENKPKKTNPFIQWGKDWWFINWTAKTNPEKARLESLKRWDELQQQKK